MAIPTEKNRLFTQVQAIHQRESLFQLLNAPLEIVSPTFVAVVVAAINQAYAVTHQEKSLVISETQPPITTLTREILDAIVLTGKKNSLEALVVLQHAFNEVCEYILEQRGTPSRLSIAEQLSQAQSQKNTSQFHSK